MPVPIVTDNIVNNMNNSSNATYDHVLENEKGAVLVTALLIMVVLTIMGAAAMSIRNTETRVAKNSEIFMRNFYALEAVALEGAASIEKLDDSVLLDSSAFPSWLKPDQTAIDLTDSDQWPSGLIMPEDTSLDTTDTDITPGGYASDGTSTGDRIWYAGIDLGSCSTSSLTDPNRRENCYDVYGMYDVKSGAGKAFHGKMMLLLGYKKVLYSN